MREREREADNSSVSDRTGSRAPYEMVSSPPLGVCKQSTDESQLGLERPLTFHGAHQSLVQVWHRRLSKSQESRIV